MTQIKLVPYQSKVREGRRGLPFEKLKAAQVFRGAGVSWGAVRVGLGWSGSKSWFYSFGGFLGPSGPQV